MKLYYALKTNGENKRHYLTSSRETLPDKVNYTSITTFHDLSNLKSFLEAGVQMAYEKREFMSIEYPGIMDTIISF